MGRADKKRGRARGRERTVMLTTPLLTLASLLIDNSCCPVGKMKDEGTLGKGEQGRKQKEGKMKEGRKEGRKKERKKERKEGKTRTRTIMITLALLMFASLLMDNSFCPV